MTEFQRSLAKVLVYEGGYSNHPDDPGGPTMKGVTQRVYDSYRKTHGLAAQSVKLITTSEIEAIYKTRYWDLMKGDRLPVGVGYVVFDGAVNSGVAQSVKWLQRALGPNFTGPIDGLVGEGTLSAVDAYPNKVELVTSICQQRLAFLKSLKTWKSFGKGWNARVNDVLITGRAWAVGSGSASAPVGMPETAKAPVSDIKDAPAKAPGDVTTGIGGATVVLSQAAGQLQQFAANPTIGNVIMWLTVAGVVLAVGGYVYREWAKRKTARIKAATA